MELSREFFKLPLRFDVARLQEECRQFSPEDWINNPKKRPGNTALILISVGGTLNHEFSVSGKMAPTPFLARCPYLRQVLATLDAPISRSRLMRLAPRSTLPRHDDVGYHWFQRVRVHVPIFTNPDVRFRCAGRGVHMAGGETWTFDNFRPHMVMNDSDEPRIHLVADTKGSPAFWDLLAKAEDPLAPSPTPSPPPRFVPYDPSWDAQVPIEAHEFDVMRPEDLDGLIGRILADAEANLDAGAFARARQRAERFQSDWRAKFAEHGSNREAFDLYEGVVSSWLDDSELEGGLLQGTPGSRALRVIRNMFVLANGNVTRSVSPEG